MQCTSQCCCLRIVTLCPTSPNSTQRRNPATGGKLAMERYKFRNLIFLWILHGLYGLCQHEDAAGTSGTEDFSSYSYYTFACRDDSFLTTASLYGTEWVRVLVLECSDGSASELYGYDPEDEIVWHRRSLPNGITRVRSASVDDGSSHAIMGEFELYGPSAGWTGGHGG